MTDGLGAFMSKEMIPDCVIGEFTSYNRYGNHGLWLAGAENESE
jgi:hypothetical protein